MRIGMPMQLFWKIKGGVVERKGHNEDAGIVIKRNRPLKPTGGSVVYMKLTLVMLHHQKVLLVNRA
jgi:hypothetical protein